MIALLNDFHFLHPYAFLALLPLVYLLKITYRHQRHHDVGQWEAVCDKELLPYLLENKRTKTSHWTLVMGFLSTFIAIIALAAPTWKRLPVPAFRNHSALVIVLSLYESMNVEDVKPSRLILARYKIADLLARRKDGQTALLVYSDRAFMVTPLTNDVETIRSQLDALTTDIMPAQGNDPVAGIQKAVQLMKQAGMPQGDILLLTDSIKTAETPLLIENLEQYHLSILGVGTTEGAPIALANGGFAKDQQGQILFPKLQVTALQNLAALGHGHYETLTADNSDIDGLTHVFDRPLTDTDQTEKINVWVEQWEDNGIWLVLLILPWAAWQFRKGVFFFIVFGCIPMPHNAEAFELRDLWRTPNQQGQRAFEKGLYEKATEKFEDIQWKGAAYYRMGRYDDALHAFQDGHNFYNLGNTFVKKGMLKDALDAYQQAINDNPTNKDAIFNKELIEHELAKQQSQANTSDQQSPKASNQKQSEANKNPEALSDSNSNASESQSSAKSEHQAGDNPPIQKTDEVKNAQTNDSKSSEQSRHEEKPDNTADTKVTSQGADRFDEQMQANEQWLKRIPDDPSILLKRKFKYQYSQQQ